MNFNEYFISSGVILILRKVNVFRLGRFVFAVMALPVAGSG